MPSSAASGPNLFAADPLGLGASLLWSDAAVAIGGPVPQRSTSWKSSTSRGTGLAGEGDSMAVFG